MGLGDRAMLPVYSVIAYSRCGPGHSASFSLKRSQQYLPHVGEGRGLQAAARYPCGSFPSSCGKPELTSVAGDSGTFLSKQHSAGRGQDAPRARARARASRRTSQHVPTANLSERRGLGVEKALSQVPSSPSEPPFHVGEDPS